MGARSLYSTVWSEPAAQDLKAILERIVATHPTNAKGVFVRFQRAVASLCTSPLRGRVVPELREYGITAYREHILTPWRVIYRIHRQEVYVLLVVDGRRNVEDVLLERLTRK